MDKGFTTEALVDGFGAVSVGDERSRFQVQPVLESVSTSCRKFAAEDGQPGKKETEGPSSRSLPDMVGEVLRCVVCLLKQRDVVALSETCRSLRQVERVFSSGQQAFPLGPTVDDRHGNTDDAVEVDTETGVLRKAVRPGMGTILARERVDKMTCYWEFKIEAFSGVRLDIGVATRRSVRRGGLDKDEVWTFDCYGRVCHGTRVRGYGCKVKAGDCVGVLLNTADCSLSFFLQGKSMGTAFRNVRPPASSGQGLYPIVVLPSVPHETLTMSRRPVAAGAIFPVPVRSLLSRKFDSRLHPNDWDIIVQTYDEQSIFRLGGLDPTRTTVGGLKKALARCGNMQMFSTGQMSLRTHGALLTDDSVLLSKAGVSFGTRGAQLQDIFLYLPHLIS